MSVCRVPIVQMKQSRCREVSVIAKSQSQNVRELEPDPRTFESCLCIPSEPQATVPSVQSFIRLALIGRPLLVGHWPNKSWGQDYEESPQVTLGVSRGGATLPWDLSKLIAEVKVKQIRSHGEPIPAIGTAHAKLWTRKEPSTCEGLWGDHGARGQGRARALERCTAARPQTKPSPYQDCFFQLRFVVLMIF